jgi:hypothetical protein
MGRNLLWRECLVAVLRASRKRGEGGETHHVFLHVDPRSVEVSARGLEVPPRTLIAIGIINVRLATVGERS